MKKAREIYEVRSLNDNHGLFIWNGASSAEKALEEINKAYEYAKSRGYDNKRDKWVIVCNQLVREFDENGVFLKEECTRFVVERVEYSENENAFVFVY